MSAEPARARYWPAQLIRSAAAVAAGLVITFSADHSAFFGLLVFGIFAVSSGFVLGWGGRRLEDRRLRAISLAEAVSAAALGIAALVFVTTGPGTLFLAIIVYGAVTGFLELYLGLRARGRHEAARDWITVGVLSALLAIAVLLVPADYALPWSADDKGVPVTGILTSQIIVVGILGAYAILVGVYLAISGFSARWSDQLEGTTAKPATGQ